MENATVLKMPNEISSRYHCGIDEWIERSIIALILFYSLICVFGVIGNGLVIFITVFRIKKTFTTVFFLNLAMADFIATFSLPVMIAFVFEDVVYMRPSTFFGKELCQFISTIKFLNLYSSVYFLMAISIGRYIFVRHPVWARNHQTPRLAFLVALGVWILSLGMSCAYLYPNTGWSYGPETLSENPLFCHGGYIFLYSYMSYSSLSMFLSHIILSFILPFIVMISCYGATMFRLRKSQFVQRGKPFKAITAVTVAFFVCWFPINSIIFIEQLHWINCAYIKVFLVAYFISDWLAYVNSCLNPFLYVFIGRHYRESLRCSVFSALENAFRDENIPGGTSSQDNSPAVAESQNL